MTRDEMIEHRARIVEFIGDDRMNFIERWGTPCGECQGAGLKLYGSTSTWRGGYGGQSFTVDVCDRCWGSGVEGMPWPSHREFYALRSARPVKGFEVGQLRREPGPTSNWARTRRVVRILELNVQGIRGKNGAAAAARVDTAIRDPHTGAWRFYGPTTRIALERLGKWKVVDPITGESK